MTTHTTPYADARYRRQCCECRAQTPVGHVRCAACAKKNQRRCIAYYAQRVKRGRCMRCHNQAEPDRVHCAACLATQREKKRQQRDGGGEKTSKRQAGGTAPHPSAAESVPQERTAQKGINRLWCCDHWIPIVTMPIRCLRCGRVYLARWPEAKGTAA
jgi:hypothetical protein